MASSPPPSPSLWRAGRPAPPEEERERNLSDTVLASFAPGLFSNGCGKDRDVAGEGFIRLTLAHNRASTKLRSAQEILAVLIVRFHLTKDHAVVGAACLHQLLVAPA